MGNTNTILLGIVYEPLIYWLALVLIVLYVPWCIVHGVILKKRLSSGV